MANLRVVSDNPVDRATITASTTSGVLAAANLQSDVKSLMWRATGKTSETLTLAAPANEVAACFHLTHCNLSPTATVRVQLYSDAAGTVLVLDTTATLACPAPARVPRGWTAANAASAHAYGGGAHARLWFASTTWRKAIITIADVNNLQGYIEGSRLILAPYWSPAVGADYGASVTALDSSKEYDLENGDTFVDAGTMKRKVDLPLSQLTAAERTDLMNIMMGGGVRYPVLVSLFPGSPDFSLERDHTVYGRLANLAATTMPSFAQYASALQVKEI